jgi:acetyltransferase-like isoleucine patch superfamily enzyme
MSKNIYERPFERDKEENAISMDVKFGKNVRVGFHVVIDPGCVIGDDVFIGNNTMIRSNVKIGAGSIIGHLVMIESDTEIGKKVTIQSQCHITKFAKIHDRVFMGPMAMCINTNRISHGRDFKAILEGPEIGFAARIGSGSIIMPGTVIGANAVVGAGALVMGAVPPGHIYVSKGVLAQFHSRVPGREMLKDGKE